MGLEVTGPLQERDRMADPHLLHHRGIEPAAVVGADLRVVATLEERVGVLFAVHHALDVDRQVLDPGHVDDRAQPGEPLLAGQIRLLPEPPQLSAGGE